MCGKGRISAFSSSSSSSFSESFSPSFSLSELDSFEWRSILTGAGATDDRLNVAI